nr:hypothetical protein [Tanacetum cinerariifolium]
MEEISGVMDEKKVIEVRPQRERTEFSNLVYGKKVDVKRVVLRQIFRARCEKFHLIQTHKRTIFLFRYLVAFSAASRLRRNSVDICFENGFDELLPLVLVVVSDLLFWRDGWICRGPEDVVLHLHRIDPRGLPRGRRLQLNQLGQMRLILRGILRFPTRLLGQMKFIYSRPDKSL